MTTADFLSDENLAEGRRLRAQDRAQRTESGRFEVVDNGFGSTTTRPVHQGAIVRNHRTTTRVAQQAAPAPSSKRQRDYIRALISERTHSAEVQAIRESLNTLYNEGLPISYNLANDTIRRLLAISKTPPVEKIELEHGRVYATVEGDFVKVAQSKSGYFYGKLWVDGEWQVVKAITKRIARQLTAEEAAAWGHEHHRCVFCNLRLSDPRSEAAGYGEVCSQKMGLPWG